MNRTDIINHLIAKNSYQTYLEIGVFNPKRNFKKVNCKRKEGVDPNGCTDHTMTSDQFFSQIPKGKKFDIIFIDGLHEEQQVDKDVANSLKHLNPNGVIVMHDCNPPTEWHQRPKEEFKEGEPWNGTTWKSFVKLRMNRSDLKMHVVDTDWGVGIVQLGAQQCYPRSDVTYSLLENDRKSLLNLLTTDDFVKKF